MILFSFFGPSLFLPDGLAHEEFWSDDWHLYIFDPNSHVRAPVQEKLHSAQESLDISFRLLGEIPLALYKRGRMCSMFFLRT